MAEVVAYNIARGLLRSVRNGPRGGAGSTRPEGSRSHKVEQKVFGLGEKPDSGLLVLDASRLDADANTSCSPHMPFGMPALDTIPYRTANGKPQNPNPMDPKPYRPYRP